MTSKKLPTHVPRLDYSSHLLKLLALGKRCDRFFPPSIEPPIEDDDERSWLDEPLHLSMVRNWISGKPATQDPERWIIKRARTIFKQLTHHAESNDKYRLGIVPGLFHHGALVHEDDETIIYAPAEPRRAATADHAMLVILEFDGVGTRWAKEVQEWLLDCGLAHAMHSTHSESTKSEFGFDTRCRMYLFPDRPLRTHEYTPVWKWWDLCLGEVADQAPKSPGSVLYPPSHPKDERARELAWATGSMGWRFDADEIVEAMASWIRKRKRTGERKLLGDLTKAGSLSEALVVDLPDGSQKTIAELEDGERFHAPDRDDANASCTIWIDAGSRRITDWSTGRHWHVIDRGTAELHEWVAEHQAQALAAGVVVSGGPAIVTDLTNERQDVSDPTEGVHSTNNWALELPDLLPGEDLQTLGAREIVVDDEDGIRAAVRENLRPGVTILIHAQPGVGKTQAAVEACAGVETLLVVTPTVALAEANATRFGAEFYGDLGPKEQPKRVSTTVHSRHKFDEVPYGAIVIDEFSSVLDQVHSPMCAKNGNVSTYMDFVDDMGTGACIMTGADVTLEQYELHVKHTRAVDPTREFVVIKCRKRALTRFVRYTTVQAAETHILDVLADLEEARLAGAAEPAAFCGVDTVEEAEALAKEILRLFPTMPVGILHGESSRGPAAHVDAWVERYKGGIVILSHCAAEGLSINVPISYVFGVHKFNLVAAQKFLQLMARARVVLNNVIVIGEHDFKEAHNPTDAEVHEKRLLARHKHVEALRGFVWPSRKENQIRCPEYFEARVLHEREKAIAANHPSVALAAARYGWPVVRVTAPEDLLLVDLEPARVVVREERRQGVLAAKDIDEVQASQHRKKTHRTKQERAELERKEIRDFYGTVSMYVLKLDQRGRGRDRFKAYANARMLQRGQGKLVAAADLRARGEAHPALEKGVILRARLLGELWRYMSNGGRVGDEGALRAEEIQIRARAFVEKYQDALWAAGYKIPRLDKAGTWARARLREGGATLVVQRVKRDGKSVRDYDVQWPEGWITEQYEARLGEMVEAQEWIDDLRKVREGAAKAA